MQVLGIITARGGSKGIPRKNLAPLNGKPLLRYTIDAAKESRLLSRLVLSTDDEEIASVGRALGADVPFLRPPELAADTTPTIPVLQDVVRRLSGLGNQQYDAIFVLQPTNPLRLSSDIDGAIELLASTGADSVISCTPVGDAHPFKMNLIEPETGKMIEPSFAGKVEGQRRQELPIFYERDGSVYLTRTEVLMRDNTIKGKDCRAWIIPEHRHRNIDTPWDLRCAEWMMSQLDDQIPGRRPNKDAT